MDFSRQSITALLLGTFSIAAMHALIPSHWLSFAVVGRRQRWPVRQTLTITLLAGIGHVLLTVVLGLALVVVGKELLRAIPAWAEHAATAAVLIALGIWFAVTGLRAGHEDCRHAGHLHNALESVSPDISCAGESAHAAGGDAQAAGLPPASTGEPRPGGRIGRAASQPTAMGALVLGMTLSPCLDLLSVYVGASALPWHTLAAISVIMSVTTLGIMLLLVWVTLLGLKHLRLDWLERNEGVAIGSILIALGILLFFL